MQKGRQYRSLDTLLPSVAAFNNRSTGSERTALMPRVHMRHSEIVADVMADMQQRASSEEGLGSLNRMVKDFGKVFSETFDEYYESGVYTIKYNLLTKWWKTYEYLQCYLFWIVVHTSNIIWTSSRHTKEICLEDRQEGWKL